MYVILYMLVFVVCISKHVDLDGLIDLFHHKYKPEIDMQNPVVG